MTLLLYGISRCPICGQPIKETERIYAFPAFVTNELDPFFFFSDGAFHKACLKRHPHGGDAIRAAEELFSKVGPGKRKCAVCKEEVTDPNDYLSLGFLSGQNTNPLYEFNYTHLHKSCTKQWGERLRFVEVAKTALVSGAWKEPSPYLSKIINDLMQI